MYEWSSHLGLYSGEKLSDAVQVPNETGGGGLGDGCKNLRVYCIYSSLGINSRLYVGRRISYNTRTYEPTVVVYRQNHAINLWTAVPIGTAVSIGTR